MFQIKGATLKVINATQQVTEKFSKREFVVTDTSSQYPQDILFQATQDKCSMLEGLQLNERVDVSFNIRGREWKSPQGEIKYFNSLEAWRIERVGNSTDTTLQSMPPQDGPNDDMGKSETDDLPF